MIESESDVVEQWIVVEWYIVVDVEAVIIAKAHIYCYVSPTAYAAEFQRALDGVYVLS